MSARTPVHPAWGVVEIGSLAVLLLVGLWVIGPQMGHTPFALVGYWVFTVYGAIAVLWLSPKVLHDDRPELRGWGWRPRNPAHPGAWRQAWPSYAAFTLAAGAVLIAWSVWQDPAVARRIRWDAVALKFMSGLFFCLVQALVFFGFVQTRIRTMIPRPSGPYAAPRHQATVATLTASLFAFAHMPNFPLMALVFVVGVFWSWIFYSRPNIVLLAVSHAVLGTILSRIVLLNMRIGPFYSEPEGYILRNAIPGLKLLIGDRF